MSLDAAVQSIEAIRGVDLQFVQRTGDRRTIRALYKQDPSASPSRGRVYLRKELGIKPLQGEYFEIGSEVLQVHEVTENAVQWIASVRLSRIA